MRASHRGVTTATLFKQRCPSKIKMQKRRKREGMIASLILTLACTPQPSRICTREYSPVCVDGNTQYNNLCLAETAGFYDACADRVSSGPCYNRGEPKLPEGLGCGGDEVWSELKRCVAKPWSDFLSCQEEARQGACGDGADPNPWVAKHCVVTCARRMS